MRHVKVFLLKSKKKKNCKKARKKVQAERMTLKKKKKIFQENRWLGVKREWLKHVKIFLIKILKKGKKKKFEADSCRLHFGGLGVGVIGGKKWIIILTNCDVKSLITRDGWGCKQNKTSEKIRNIYKVKNIDLLFVCRRT